MEAENQDRADREAGKVPASMRAPSHDRDASRSKDRPSHRCSSVVTTPLALAFAPHCHGLVWERGFLLSTNVVCNSTFINRVSAGFVCISHTVALDATERII